MCGGGHYAAFSVGYRINRKSITKGRKKNMSIPNGKNVYGYAEAYAKLANFGQQHLLKY